MTLNKKLRVCVCYRKTGKQALQMTDRILSITLLPTWTKLAWHWPENASHTASHYSKTAPHLLIGIFMVLIAFEQCHNHALLYTIQFYGNVVCVRLSFQKLVPIDLIGYDWKKLCRRRVCLGSTEWLIARHCIGKCRADELCTRGNG